MKSRMEGILTRLAQRHAVYLLQGLPEDQDRRIGVLADGLAKNGILIIAAEVPGGNYDEQVSEWVGVYGELYRMLARALFPSFTEIDAVYADNLQPPIVIIEGEAAPVIQALAGYVAPLLAVRERDALVSEAELRGVMSFILDELEAKDLANEMATMLWREGVRMIGQLLQMPVTHYAVTGFSRPLFQKLKDRVPAEEPLRAVVLPEDAPNSVPVESGSLFKSKIPLFFERKSGNRRPPVPLPPFHDEGG